jgi:hypothetical protein
MHIHTHENMTRQKKICMHVHVHYIYAYTYTWEHDTPKKNNACIYTYITYMHIHTHDNMTRHEKICTHTHIHYIHAYIYIHAIAHSPTKGDIHSYLHLLHLHSSLVVKSLLHSLLHNRHLKLVNNNLAVLFKEPFPLLFSVKHLLEACDACRDLELSVACESLGVLQLSLWCCACV